MIESICETCAHKNICRYYEPDEECSACNQFLNKSRFVELPCGVGDKVWYLNPVHEICEALVESVEFNIYTNPQIWISVKYYSELFGEHRRKGRIDMMLNKTVFLAREEVEAAQAERRNE